jgi:hypothetical protein
MAAISTPRATTTRIEVVNFAALPGTRVDLGLTFYDSAGQPGT